MEGLHFTTFIKNIKSHKISVRHERKTTVRKALVEIVECLYLI